MNDSNHDSSVDVSLSLPANWKKVERDVDSLQKRLSKATEERNKRAVRYIKHLIRQSVYVRLLDGFEILVRMYANTMEYHIASEEKC